MKTKVALDLTLVTHGSDLPELARQKMCLAIIEAAGEIAIEYGYYVESANGGIRLVEPTGPGQTVTHGIPDDSGGEEHG